MRLIELRLDAYGPFAGSRLCFDRAAPLHVVFGANEAGKTSALAAIGDLFFGVPPRSEKSFLRPADLRLGATIEARNGQTLQFFRRRGAKAGLLDAGGAPLPEDCLAPFLGAVSRDVFTRVFGLDAKELREGGAAMMKVDGEMGASLFAAASGLRGLIDLRKGLEAEADEIFGDRKAGRRSFYQALDRYNEALKAARESSLSEGALKTLRRQVVEADDGAFRDQGARRRRGGGSARAGTNAQDRAHPGRAGAAARGLTPSFRSLRFFRPTGRKNSKACSRPATTPRRRPRPPRKNATRRRRNAPRRNATRACWPMPKPSRP